jgi:hypothetical protein
MDTTTSPTTTVSNSQPQEAQAVTTRTDATKVLKAGIPQAITDLGGVAKSDDIKAWILNKENAVKADFGMCMSAGVLKKYPNGRYNFDIAYVSQTVAMKKKGLLFTPAWSWLSLTPDAQLPNGVEGKLPKNRAELKAGATSQEETQETISSEVVETQEEVIEVTASSELSDAEQLELEQTQRNNAYMEEHGEDSLTPKGGEVEVYVNEDNLRIGVDAKGNEWYPQTEENISSEVVETQEEVVEPQETISSEVVEPQEVIFQDDEDDIWDDILDDEPMSQVLGLEQLPSSPYFGKVEELGGNKTLILSESESGVEAYSISLNLDPQTIEEGRAQKMYRKLQVGELAVADKLLSFFRSHNPQNNLKSHMLSMGVPFNSL